MEKMGCGNNGGVVFGGHVMEMPQGPFALRHHMNCTFGMVESLKMNKLPRESGSKRKKEIHGLELRIQKVSSFLWIMAKAESDSGSAL